MYSSWMGLVSTKNGTDITDNTRFDFLWSNMPSLLNECNLSLLFYCKQRRTSISTNHLKPTKTGGTQWMLRIHKYRYVNCEGDSLDTFASTFHRCLIFKVKIMEKNSIEKQVVNLRVHNTCRYVYLLFCLHHLIVNK